MIALRPHALSPIATLNQLKNWEDVEFEGVLLDVAQTVGSLQDGNILELSQAVVQYSLHEGAIIGVSQAITSKYQGVIAGIAQSVRVRPVDPVNQNAGYPFVDLYGQHFSVRIITALGEIDPCEMMNDIKITQEESKAFVAEFSLKKDAGERIDLFQYLNKSIRIEFIYPSKPAFTVYEGIIDAGAWEVGGFYLQWSATTQRNKQIEAMNTAQVQAIGVHNEHVFRPIDEYDDTLTQVEDRLRTVPASLDFFGNAPVLTSWFPKNAVDFSLNACDIQRQNISNTVQQQDKVINKVTVKIQNQWDLLYHAERWYSFNSGYTPCDYSIWGLPPSNSTVKSAAQGTGWVLSNYKSKGLAPYGMYQCYYRGGKSGWMIWSPMTATFSDPEKGESEFSTVVTDYTNQYANAAEFMLSTRWAQPIEESINIIRQNSASISRYGERKSTINVSVRQERDKATNRKIKRWESYTTYTNPTRAGAKKQANGYWILRADDIDKSILAKAAAVAGRIADTMILDSHRTIELSLRTGKIASNVNVTQTASVDFQHIKGKFKVAAVTHYLDLVNKFTHTDITFKLFTNAENQAYFIQDTPPPRADLKLYPNPTYVRGMGVSTIGKGARVFQDEDEYLDYLAEGQNDFIGVGNFLQYKARGLIREHTQTIGGLKVGVERDFQVIADEIEEESTDTMEISVDKTVEIGVPNNNQELTA